MINFKIEKPGEVGVLILEESLTIQCADELKKELMRSLDSVDHVMMNLEKVTDVDLSCIQLLSSAHQTAMRSNKLLTITGISSEPFKKAVEYLGFSRHTGCKFDCNKSCLWLEGGC